MLDKKYFLFQIYIQYYGSAHDHERARAVDSTVLALQVYFENATDCPLGQANDFMPLSSILGRLCPRLADSLCSVRHAAIRAIWLSFRLSLLHRGHSPQDTELVDSALFDLSAFIETRLGSEGKLDQHKCRTAIAVIAKVSNALRTVMKCLLTMTIRSFRKLKRVCRKVRCKPTSRFSSKCSRTSKAM